MNEMLKAIVAIPLSLLAFTLGKNIFHGGPQESHNPLPAVSHSVAHNQPGMTLVGDAAPKSVQQFIHEMAIGVRNRYPNGQPISQSGDLVGFMDEGQNQVIYRNEWQVRPEVLVPTPQAQADTKNAILAGFRAKTCKDRVFVPLMQQGMTVTYKSVYAGQTLMSVTFGIRDCL